MDPPTDEPTPCLDMEIKSLRTEIEELKAQLTKSQLTEESFCNDDQKILAYTGLPKFNIFMSILKLVSPYLRPSTLTPFQCVLLTLAKLKLNVSMNYLGYIFLIHQSTVSRIFTDVIHVLNTRFASTCIFWPERDGVLNNMPVDFQSLFPRCTSIIDCFEVFIDRSARLDNRSSTYSNYKSHNTSKYLISVTPQGFVNFISFGWGGRSSDKKITESSGYLTNLCPGDQVLADRGFNIADLIALQGASLHIPAFTKGKPQLSNIELTSTRQIASVRIHVERVIGNVRQKYPILSSTIPVNFLQVDSTSNCTTLDKIVHVCCALTNVCEGIVPLY